MCVCCCCRKISGKKKRKNERRRRCRRDKSEFTTGINSFPFFVYVCVYRRMYSLVFFLLANELQWNIKSDLISSLVLIESPDELYEEIHFIA